MSVAFRRDVDEEHLEPRPDMPIPPGPNLVTARGLALIETKIVAFEVALTTAVTDDEIKAIERDLRYWRARRSTAQVMPEFRGDVIRFGACVTYRDTGNITHIIDIVGYDEADPNHGKIAFSSPLARALIGASQGDMVDFAGQVDALEIVAVC